MRRIGLVFALFALPLVASAQEEGGGIDVIDVSGPLDGSALDFISDTIERSADSNQLLVVLQINSKAVLDAESFGRLLQLVEKPPLPLAVWVGPAPAQAFGGAAVLAMEAGQSAIAPGSALGHLRPQVLGVDPAESTEMIAAEESGLELQATIRQYLQDLNGRTFETASGPVSVETITSVEDGVTLKQTTLHKPGFGVRFFRLAVTPEAAFFFLVVGLAIVTFEFFALGPGVAAGVAAVSLVLAGWGIINLPVRWWAVALALAGWGLLTGAYQKGGLLAMTIGGASFLQISGMFFIDGGGQIDPRWYLVLPSVLAVLFFFLIAMPTVQRARLSTQTIGRDALLNHRGVALVDFDPDGIVEVDGARWRATAHREASLREGSPIVVTGVDGLYLEVDPIAEERET